MLDASSKESDTSVLDNKNLKFLIPRPKNRPDKIFSEARRYILLVVVVSDLF
jgi:hypothetical protein